VTPDEVRAAYPVLDRHAYLNAGSVGPLSRRSHQATVEWAERGLREGRGSRRFFEAATELRASLRAAIARLVGVPTDRVLLTTSTTDGCNLVVTGLRLGPEDEVVITDGEHPAIEEPVAASGARVRVARVLGRPRDEVLHAVLGEVTPRTRLIALSHVLWYNGQVMPVAEIRRAAGVPVLVDGAQSAGAIPVDAGAVDFYALPGQKWLCGPELTGALVVADGASLDPPVAGYGRRMGEGVERLAVSYPPAPSLAGLIAALEERPPWAFERAAEMARRCREALLDAGLDVCTPAGEATLVAFTVPGDPAETVSRCLERDVVIRSLPNGWLRASCGWWTSDGDVDRLVGALREA
jgi:L-cysteine/cystine lyase